MVETMNDVPAELIEAVQGLATEGLPVDQIAFMTHTSKTLVEQILREGQQGGGTEGSVNTTSDGK